MLVHNVFVTLKDGSSESVDSFLAASREFLEACPEVVFSTCGTLVEDLVRPVNDRDFHVGIHVVFMDRGTHDAYQLSDLHQKFIADHKDGWAQARVFDTDC